MTPAKTARLAYIDSMRGIACVIMFQAHCYNSWLNADARKSRLYRYSQAAATVPAPLFLLVAGISCALIARILRENGATRAEIARTTIRRGAEIYALGLAFRLQEFILGYRWSPWTDLLRVDILNMLGLSIMLLGLLYWLVARVDRAASGRNIVIASLTVATLVALLTPWLWTTYRPRWLPWPLESYINGVHIFAQPQVWLFPLFPWTGFAFLGLALGLILFSDFARRREALVFATTGGVGFAACAISMPLDAAPLRMYPAAIYDYWHTSPNFFLMRCGTLLLLLSLVYAWCRWGWAQTGFSPVIQLGKTSLLVYWVHIEFVYGRFSILPKGKCGILKATAGLLAIFLAMVALSVARTRWKRKPSKGLQPAPAPAAAATAESG